MRLIIPNLSLDSNTAPRLRTGEVKPSYRGTQTSVQGNRDLCTGEPGWGSMTNGRIIPLRPFGALPLSQGESLMCYPQLCDITK